MKLENRLDAQIEAMFHDAHPVGCPTDPFEKQSFLRGHALLALLKVKGTRLGRPEIVVVEDHTNPLPDGRPSLDWGADLDLPHELLEQLRPTASVCTVTVRNGVVIEAPGRLDFGREHTVGEPGPTTGPARAVRDLCDPWVPCPVQPNEVASRDLVAPWRQNGFGEFAAVV